MTPISHPLWVSFKGTLRFIPSFPTFRTRMIRRLPFHSPLARLALAQLRGVLLPRGPGVEAHGMQMHLSPQTNPLVPVNSYSLLGSFGVPYSLDPHLLRTHFRAPHHTLQTSETDPGP